MQDVSNCAVSLGFLLSFADKVPNGYTTSEVVQRIVKPATSSYRCRYVTLPTVPSGAVGRSQFFVSHRWNADFVHELVALVIGKFADAADAAIAKEASTAITAHSTVALGRSPGHIGDSTAGGVSPRAPFSTPQAPLYPHTSGTPNEPGRASTTTVHQPRSKPSTATASAPGYYVPSSVTVPPSRESSWRAALQPSGGSASSQDHPPRPGQLRSATFTSLINQTSFRLRASRDLQPGCASSPSPSDRWTATDVPAADDDAGGFAAGGGRVPSGPGFVPCPSLPGSAFNDILVEDMVAGAPYRTGGATGAAGGAGGSSFSASLNPLHARPSCGTFDLPYGGLPPAPPLSTQQLVAGSGSSRRAFATWDSASRRSSLSAMGACGTGAGVGGSSFSCRGASVTTVVVGAPAENRSGAGTSALSAPSPPPPVPTARRDGLKDIAGRGGVGGSSFGRASAKSASGSGVSDASDAAAVGPTARPSTASSSSCTGSRRSTSQGVTQGGTAGAAAAAFGDGLTAGGGGGVSSTAAAATAGAGSNVEVVERLRQRFVGREELLRDTFVWLDIFAINQHPNSSQADDLAKLQDVVAASEATLLVCDSGGLVLTRIWCLYEIWQTVRQQGPKALQVLAGPLDSSALERVWGDLDVERAQATVESDRLRILADIRATTGSDPLNRHIKKAIVESAARDLEVTRAAAPRTPAHGERALRAAVITRAAGSASAALATAREAAEVYGSCRGPAHADTLRALRVVALCHRDLGAASLALGLLEQQVLPFLKEAYGPGYTEYDTLNDMGMLQFNLGQYESAYDSLLMALSQMLHQLLDVIPAPAAAQLRAAIAAPGPLAKAAEAAATTASVAALLTDPGTGAAPGWTEPQAARGGMAGSSPRLAPLTGEPLAALLAALRAVVEASPEVTVAPGIAAAADGRVTEDRGADRGNRDGSSGSAGRCRAVFVATAERLGLALHSLGLVQVELSRRRRSPAGGVALREARELMEAAVGLLEAFSGANRGMQAADARSDLAELLMEGHDMQAAERLHRANLALTESVYGRDHPHAATALNKLAMCLKRQRSSHPDKVSEAESLYRRCLAVCQAGLGEAHPETLVVATNLGVLLADQRQWSESERLLTGAVANLDPSLAPSHPDVMAAHRRLAEVLELRNKLFEAEAMFRLTLQFAESAPPDRRDHGLVLECREGLARVQERLEAAARAEVESACCVVS